ncbi:MAG: ABC transporter ATP-binding protein [Pseudolabrys sp.]
MSLTATLGHTAATSQVAAGQHDPAIPTSAPLIRARGLVKVYSTVSGDPVVALDDMNLSMADGEFVSIVGPSGCGKSTMLRLLAGLDKPDAGEMTLGNQAITGPSSAVGVVFQNATLLPWMTVWQNVILPLQVGGGNRAAREGAVRDYLSIAGLSGFENQYPYELSGGMQQRAAIVRGLARDPKVLLMDEPFGALDALTRERMNGELQRIWMASKKTVLLITHSIGEAIFLGDRVIVMSGRPGRVLEDLRVNLPRPRNHAETIADPEYIRLAREIRRMLDA